MRKQITLLILFICCCIQAQTSIGDALSNNKNILKIKDDNTKGVVLSYSNAYTNFPKYSATDSDLFTDLPNLAGGILYNKTDDQYYKYDGFAWNPAKQVQAIFNPRVSRIGATSGFSRFCLSFGVGLCFPGNPPVFKMANNNSQVLIDNLVMKNTSDYLQITRGGTYDLVSAININGLVLGATIQLKEYKLTVQARPLGSTDNNAWKSIAQKKSYTIILIVAGDGADTSFVHTLNIAANTELRLLVEVIASGADAGQVGLAGTNLDPLKTYFGARLIRAN